MEADADQLLERAGRALDLSEVPKSVRKDVEIESVMLLKEILDRLLLPPIDSVPNAQMVAAARNGRLGSFVHRTGPLRWRVPNTEIAIEEVAEGPRAGEFLFSIASTKRLHDDYDEVEDLPYRVGRVGSSRDYRSPQLSRGLYDAYISTPGYLVPDLHFLSGLVEALPERLKVRYAEQTLWQWLGLILATLAAAAIGYGAIRLVKRMAKGLDRPLNRWARLLSPLVVAVIVATALRFVDQEINLTGKVLVSMSIAAKAVIVVAAAWAALIFFKAVAESIIAAPKLRIAEDSIDATMWRIGASIVGFLSGAWILVAGLQSLGANVVPLLAGLGVGGLAVALAAQNTLTDIFGSLIILADRPYRIGHWVIIGDKEGHVESIGVRSTRIRTFYNSVLTIPNSAAVSKIIDNMGMRNYRRVYTKLGIRYDTPPERIEAFLEGVKRIIQTNPTTRKDYFHVVFNDFGAHSLTIMLYFFVKVPDWSAELVERQRVFLEVVRLADELGVEFAFPTQTLEIERFPGQPGRQPVAAAGDDELRAIAHRFASKDQSAKPRGLGIFVPPHEDKGQ